MGWANEIKTCGGLVRTLTEGDDVHTDWRLDVIFNATSIGSLPTWE